MKMEAIAGRAFTEDEMSPLHEVLDPLGSINYMVTDTVFSNLNKIKLKHPYEYKALAKLPSGKRTFFLPNNEVLRMTKYGNLIRLMYVSKSKVAVEWENWWAETDTGISSINKNIGVVIDEEFELLQYDDKIDIAEYKAFALLCFIFLMDVEEKIIDPYAKVGTRKHGKIVNDSNLGFIHVDSKWNVTSIRTEGFDVSGHFALRWAGTGRTEARIVFIKPFEKHGYVRKAHGSQD